MGKISDFIAASRRILVVSKKPAWSDYKTMAKITGLGMIFIALIGFAIALIFRLLCGMAGICL